MNTIEANNFSSGLISLIPILFGLILVVVVIFLFWVLPIMLGIKQARKKNYSPAWMCLGIHPLFGWIAFIVLVCVRPRIRCASCGGFVKDNFFKCPFCHEAVSANPGQELPPRL